MWNAALHIGAERLKEEPTTYLRYAETKGAAGDGVERVAAGADAGLVRDDLELAIVALALEDARDARYVGRVLQGAVPIPEGRLVVAAVTARLSATLDPEVENRSKVAMASRPTSQVDARVHPGPVAADDQSLGRVRHFDVAGQRWPRRYRGECSVRAKQGGPGMVMVVDEAARLVSQVRDSQTERGNGQLTSETFKSSGSGVKGWSKPGHDNWGSCGLGFLLILCACEGK